MIMLLLHAWQEAHSVFLCWAEQGVERVTSVRRDREARDGTLCRPTAAGKGQKQSAQRAYTHVPPFSPASKLCWGPAALLGPRQQGSADCPLRVTAWQQQGQGQGQLPMGLTQGLLQVLAAL